MLIHICDLIRSRRQVWNRSKTAIAVAIGGGLFLLCACAVQEQLTLAPTGAPPPARTVSPATPLAPTYAPSPSPPPTVEPVNSPPTHTLAVADLAVQTHGPVQVVPGETTSYTLTIRNDGPAPATDIVLTNVLPEGAIPAWTQPAHPVCGRRERGVSCDAGDLRKGDAATVTLDLSIGGTETLITGTQLAGVTWDLSEPTCVIDQDSIPAQVTCRLAHLQPGADVEVRIGANVDARTTGPLVHTVTVAANEPDANLSNNQATFTMTLGPAGATLSGAEEAVAVTAIPTATDLILQADGPSSVTAGQPFTYTFTIANQGTQDATGVSFEDVLPLATDLDGYTPAAPLCEQRDDALTCTLRDPGSGKAITFTLVITGHRGQPVVMELDPLMPGWPVCTVLKERTYLHIVTCELGVLKPGQATHVQLALTAAGVLERSMVNAASVSANETDLNPLDNTDTATITVQVRADVAVWSAVSGPAVAGKPLSYTLTVVNLGPSDADVVLTDTLPMGAMFVSAVPSHGDNCRLERSAASSDTVVCGLGRLGGGETATVIIVVAVDETLTPALAESIVHSATVAAGQLDPDPSNNALAESIPVSAGVKD